MPSLTSTILQAHPILVITPYGTRAATIVDMILMSLHTSGLVDMQTVHIITASTPHNQGILISDDIHAFTVREYNPEAIPILVVEWSVREYHIRMYRNFIQHRELKILYPEFVPELNAPNIVVYDDDVVNHITCPCIIFSPDASQFLDIPNARVVFAQENTVLVPEHHMASIIMTTSFKCIPASMHAWPLHILAFESDSGFQLFLYPEYKNISIYLTPRTQHQYKLLCDGIADSNAVYQNLVDLSTPILQDTYRNLYLR